MEPTISGLYWRKSLWNGFACIPVILRLDANTLTLKTRKGIEWQVMISETKCRFTAFGTMIITVNQKEYAFVVAGATVSRSFSKEQLAELGQTNGQYAVGADMAVRAGTAATTLGTGGAAGASIATAAYAAAAVGNIDTWRGIFRSLSLLESENKEMNLGRNLLLLMIGGMVIGTVLFILFKIVWKVD